MKNEVKVFFCGIAAAVVSIAAFIFGRKSNSDGKRIQSDSGDIDELKGQSDSIREEITGAKRDLEEALSILRNAKERSEKGQD